MGRKTFDYTIQNLGPTLVEEKNGILENIEDANSFEINEEMRESQGLDNLNFRKLTSQHIKDSSKNE